MKLAARPLRAALALLLSALPALGLAAGPVFKCVIDGSVTFQNTPCPAQGAGPRPTVEQLNAETRKRREAEAARQPANAAAPPPAATQSTPAPKGTPGFRCDGRKYCSQMSSCAEARYFLQHCPGVQMDGNHDGVPCEQQWCGR